MSNFRFFPANVERLAARCIDQPVSDEPFEIVGDALGVMSGAVPIVMKSSRLPAFAKPHHVNEHTLAGVASEKIASDLAFHLGLPVAPVQINKTGADHQMTAFVAVSYPALPSARGWRTVWDTLDAGEKATLRPTLSAMWAFHAWIQDLDHNWNDANAMLEKEGTHLRAVFFDYTLCLAHGAATGSGPLPAKAWGSAPNTPYPPLDRDAMVNVVNLIETKAEAILDNSLNSVPAACFQPGVRARLREGLLQRKDMLRAALFL